MLSNVNQNVNTNLNETNAKMIQNKTYTAGDVVDILNKKIAQITSDKNAYIAKNGLEHRDALSAFDVSISTLIDMMYTFAFGKGEV